MWTEETNSLETFAEKSNLNVAGLKDSEQQIKVNETLI
jgi:hypothetical protein